MKLVLILGLLVSLPALSCSCARWGSAKEMLKRSTSAFIGVPSEDSKVTGTTNPNNISIMSTPFSVVKNFKPSSVNPKKKTIYSENFDGANCGAVFRKSEALILVFTYTERRKEFTSACDLANVNDEEAIRLISELSI